MRKIFMVFTFLIFIPFVSFAQSVHSPYTGEEKREIKALSSEDIEGYLKGHGMGFAKTAELNHYPGPNHVLDFAKELALSKEQLDRTKETYDEMHKDAVSSGRQIVERERILDNSFANQEIDEKGLMEMTVEIGRLKGELRAVNLKAHLKMREILSSHQADKYDELRGYQGNGGKHKHQHHKYHSDHH